MSNKKMMFICIGIFALIAIIYFLSTGTFNPILLVLLLWPLMQMNDSLTQR